MRSEILARAEAIWPEQVRTRRDLHMHPEVHFEVHRTAGLVADRLRAMGLEVKTGVGRTGVVGTLRGRGPGKVVGLRADMDALAMLDRKDVPYRSTVEGACHACGHDGHTTMVLGAAEVLAGLRDRFDGEVRFIFQPAEENPSGGALAMMADGVLGGLDAIFGMHLWPDLPAGTLAAQVGPTMAASDYCHITITGRGGHAAMPHLCVDSVTIAAQVITALQQVVSRQVDPFDSAVLTIGMIRGGERPNVIAHETEFSITLRTIHPETRDRLPGQIDAIVKGIAEGYGATGVTKWRHQTNITINDRASAELVRSTTADLLGPEAVSGLERPSMAGEDFGYFLEKVPGCYFKVDCRNEAMGFVHALHHPLFDFDERALTVGTVAAAGSLLKALGAF